MDKTRVVELPVCGEKMTIRPIGTLERHRVAGALPNILQATLDEMVTAAKTQKTVKAKALEKSIAEKMSNVTAETVQAMNEARIRYVLMCVVEPKLWADMRPSDDQMSDPRSCPKGFREFDLVEADFEVLWNALDEFTDEQVEHSAEVVRPLSKTQAAS